MSDLPLVTVVCLCYNQERFVFESINSVIDQTYPNLEIIVIDDASTDNSRKIIQQLDFKERRVQTIFLKNNVGNCRAFNHALPLMKGEFVVDFASDDVMTPDRIEKQVAKFQTLGGSFGVVFTDAVYVDESGYVLRNHYDYLFKKGLLKRIPEGDVYAELLSTYFIASPTMLVRTQVMQDLKGYDETLSYEDFDFWIRSSIRYQYAFLNEKLTKIRKLTKSMSTGWYQRGDKQLHSTYLVCRKAQVLNRDEKDVEALVKRLKYELRHSVFSQNYEEAALFFNFLNEMKQVSFADRVLIKLNSVRLPLSLIRQAYHRLRYS